MYFLQGKKLYSTLPLWIVLLTLLGVHIYLAMAPTRTVLRWYSYDDAFYYFKTAQNFAHGQGMTFDGIGQTNGFHPLWMAICIPIFALARHAGDLLPLRLLVVVVGLTLTLSAFLLYRTARPLWGESIALLLAAFWGVRPSLYKALSAGGMETSLSALSLVVLWGALIPVWRDPSDTKSLRRLGWAAVFAMLARLDNSLIVATIGLGLLIRWWKQNIPLRRWVTLAWLFGGPGLIGVGGFLLWSRFVVGTWLPISSQFKMWWGNLPDTPYGGRALRYRILSASSTWLHTPLSEWRELWQRYRYSRKLMFSLATGVSQIVAAFAIGFVWLRKFRWQAEAFQRAALLPLSIGVVVHLFYMRVLSGMAALRYWYWTPERFLVALLLGWGMWIVAQWVSKWRPQWFSRWQWFGLFAASLISLTMTFQFGHWFLHVYRPNIPGEHLYLHQAHWLEEHTPPGSRIGMTGAGAMGYFVHDRTIIGLDGLISTPAYLDAWKHHTVISYFQQAGLQYLFVGFWFEQQQPYRDVFAHHLQLIDVYHYHANDGGMGLFRFSP